MKYLLDTHVFLWFILDNEKISSKALNIISNRNNELFLSAASGWEVAIKAHLGKIQLNNNPEIFIPEHLSANSIKSLPIKMSHMLHTFTLPFHHKDPFDRLIISQAQLEKMSIITADPLFEKYTIKLLW